MGLLEVGKKEGDTSVLNVSAAEHLALSRRGGKKRAAKTFWVLD